MSWQHLGSYQDVYRLVTVRTHGDVIVLPQLADQATGIITGYPTQSHYPNTQPTIACPILIMQSASLGSDKYSVLSDWVDTDQSLNQRDHLISLKEAWMLNSFGHLVKAGAPFVRLHCVQCCDSESILYCCSEVSPCVHLYLRQPCICIRVNFMYMQ